MLPIWHETNARSCPPREGPPRVADGGNVLHVRARATCTQLQRPQRRDLAVRDCALRCLFEEVGGLLGHKLVWRTSCSCPSAARRSIPGKVVSSSSRGVPRPSTMRKRPPLSVSSMPWCTPPLTSATCIDARWIASSRQLRQRVVQTIAPMRQRRWLSLWTRICSATPPQTQ